MNATTRAAEATPPFPSIDRRTLVGIDERLAHLADLSTDVQFEDWQFFMGRMGDGHYVQVRFTAPDNATGEERSWSGRKWYISRHATDAEVVQTMLKAVLTAVEHEARERFLYKGRAIFSPHLDLEALVRFVDAHDEVHRKEAA